MGICHHAAVLYLGFYLHTAVALLLDLARDAKAAFRRLDKAFYIDAAILGPHRHLPGGSTAASSLALEGINTFGLFDADSISEAAKTMTTVGSRGEKPRI